jgi:hypothetical protein
VKGKRRIRLSYANVVASLALFAALGGSSYAAISLPAGSVGTKQLHKRAVTGAKIKKNAITGGKVKDGSLLKQDFAAGQLPAGPRGEKARPARPARPAQRAPREPTAGSPRPVRSTPASQRTLHP